MNLFKKIKNSLVQAWAWISFWWQDVGPDIDMYAQIAVKAVNAVKKGIESKSFDTVTALIKSFTGDATDAVIDKVIALLKQHIPKLSIQLEIIAATAGATDSYERIRHIFLLINTGVTDEQWQKFCSGLGQQIVYALADGKLTWGEAGCLVEYYYQNKPTN